MELAPAHAAVTAAEQALAAAKAQRDQAIVDAYNSGTSAIEIAPQVNLTRQQIHRIVASTMTETVAGLRREVMDGGARYEDLIEDDQVFVDHEVGRLARARGISLD